MLESLRLNLFGDASPAGSSDKSGPGLFSFGHKDESPADQFARWQHPGSGVSTTSQLPHWLEIIEMT